MTLKQKQALLTYLGYYDVPLDGLWGEKSQKATEAFQRDYEREQLAAYEQALSEIETALGVSG